MTDQLDRITDLARQIIALAAAQPVPDPGPGALAPPANFRATYDASTRRVTCAWTPQADDVERHERWKDPANTLKATIPAGGGASVSSALAGGPYEWALRSRRGEQVSAFTPWIRTDVPPAGSPGSAPGGDPGGSDPGGSDPGGSQPPSSGGPFPSDVLPVLKDWTIMLPTGSPGDPDNRYIVAEAVADTYFVRGGGVVFRAHPGTANHSEGSKYGRCEARQMVPGQRWVKSTWDSGTAQEPAPPQRLRARLAIDTSHLAYPIVNGLQIHDGADDVIQVQARNGVLGIAHDDGASWEIIDAYSGQVFDMDIYVTGHGEIVFTYNGAEAVRIPKTGTGWYWKAGCYPNTGGTNDKRPEQPDAAAEVVIYALAVDPA